MNSLAIMENVRRYRTIASLYRQTAAFRPLPAVPCWRKPRNGSIAPSPNWKPTLTVLPRFRQYPFRLRSVS